MPVATFQEKARTVANSVSAGNMLRLSLLRHAKSSWDSPDLSDHERPLNKRGTKAASRIGRYIVELDLVPELILCSDATRTRDTLTLVLSQLTSPTPKVRITQTLYLAAPNTILKAIKKHAKTPAHIMVIGHNPGLHALALSLPANDDAADKRSDLASLTLKFPTAALAHIHFDCDDWRDIGPASGRLDTYVTPRTLPE